MAGPITLTEVVLLPTLRSKPIVVSPPAVTATSRRTDSAKPEEVAETW